MEFQKVKKYEPRSKKCVGSLRPHINLTSLSRDGVAKEDCTKFNPQSGRGSASMLTFYAAFISDYFI